MGRGVAVCVLDPALPHPSWPAGVDHVRGGVDDAEAVREAAVGCDVIFHTAGIWDGGAGGADRMVRVNVDGTASVLDTGCVVVYTSSSITCGFGPRHQPGGEEAPSEDPRHPIRGTGRIYRETKLAAEALVASAGGFLVNPDYVIGPGDVHQVVTRPLLMAARLPVIPAPGGGKSFVDVDDVADAHLLVLERGVPGRRYLIGAENRSYVEVFRELAGILGRRPLITHLPVLAPRLLRHFPPLRQTAGAVEQMCLPRYRSSARARGELGWRPRPVSQALRRTVYGRFYEV